MTGVSVKRDSNGNVVLVAGALGVAAIPTVATTILASGWLRL